MQREKSKYKAQLRAHADEALKAYAKLAEANEAKKKLDRALGTLATGFKALEELRKEAAKIMEEEPRRGTSAVLCNRAPPAVSMGLARTPRHHGLGRCSRCLSIRIMAGNPKGQKIWGCFRKPLRGFAVLYVE